MKSTGLKQINLKRISKYEKLVKKFNFSKRTIMELNFKLKDFKWK